MGGFYHVECHRKKCQDKEENFFPRIVCPMEPVICDYCHQEIKKEWENCHHSIIPKKN